MGFVTPVWMVLGCGFGYGFVWAFGLLAMCVLISVGGFWVLRSRVRDLLVNAVLVVLPGG